MLANLCQTKFGFMTIKKTIWPQPMNYQRVKIELIKFLPFMTLFGHNKINQPS